MKTEINGKVIKLPDFLLVGAAKSGTTSLYEYLGQHPQIFIPERKEPEFFVSDGKPDTSSFCPTPVWKLHDYSELFEPAHEEQVLGEASTPYLYLYERAIRNIKHYVPTSQNIRIIIILRNPVERAFSHFLKFSFHGVETKSFGEALKRKSADINKAYRSNWNRFDYIGYGLYYAQVKAYIENFPHVKVCLNEDLRHNPYGLAAELFRFLEVDDSFVPDMERKHNRTGEIRSRLLHRIISTPGFLSSGLPLGKLVPLRIRVNLADRLKHLNSNFRKRPEMEQNDRKYLIDIYREDILRLQDLIGRDLTSWLV